MGGGCYPVDYPCSIFSSISGLYPLDARNLTSPPLSSNAFVMTEIVCLAMCPSEGKNFPQLHPI